jgi:hypothetical protein
VVRGSRVLLPEITDAAAGMIHETGSGGRGVSGKPGTPRRKPEAGFIRSGVRYDGVMLESGLARVGGVLPAVLLLAASLATAAGLTVAAPGLPPPDPPFLDLPPEEFPADVRASVESVGRETPVSVRAVDGEEVLLTPAYSRVQVQLLLRGADGAPLRAGDWYVESSREATSVEGIPGAWAQLPSGPWMFTRKMRPEFTAAVGPVGDGAGRIPRLVFTLHLSRLGGPVTRTVPVAPGESFTRTFLDRFAFLGREGGAGVWGLHIRERWAEPTTGPVTVRGICQSFDVLGTAARTREGEFTRMRTWGDTHYLPATLSGETLHARYVYRIAGPRRTMRLAVEGIAFPAK